MATLEELENYWTKEDAEQALAYLKVVDYLEYKATEDIECKQQA